MWNNTNTATVFIKMESSTEDDDIFFEEVFSQKPCSKDAADSSSAVFRPETRRRDNTVGLGIPMEAAAGRDTKDAGDVKLETISISSDTTEISQPRSASGDSSEEASTTASSIDLGNDNPCDDDASILYEGSPTDPAGGEDRYSNDTQLTCNDKGYDSDTEVGSIKSGSDCSDWSEYFGATPSLRLTDEIPDKKSIDSGSFRLARLSSLIVNLEEGDTAVCLNSSITSRKCTNPDESQHPSTEREVLPSAAQHQNPKSPQKRHLDDHSENSMNENCSATAPSNQSPKRLCLNTHNRTMEKEVSSFLNTPEKKNTCDSRDDRNDEDCSATTLMKGTEHRGDLLQNHIQQEEPCTVDNDDSDFYGLGQDVKVAVFSTFKIKSLHPWQSKVLKQHCSENSGKSNALVVAPTSGGKTLVAVIILLRSMLIDKRDTILALPYIALVTEKLKDLRVLANKLHTFSVMEYASSRGRFPIPVQQTILRRLYVATFEKASGIWRYLCKEGERRFEIGTVIFDEFHMISQGLRGTVIEGLVVSLLRMSGGAVGLVALTATVGNPQELRRFLGGGNDEKCILYEVNVRPITINEQIVVGGSSIPVRRGPDGKGLIDFEAKGVKILPDNDRLADKKLLSVFSAHKDRIICKLVFDAMDHGRQVIVFCSSRKGAVHYCSTFTKARAELYRDQKGVSDLLLKQRRDLIGHLRQESKRAVAGELLAGIEYGIGFHSGALHPLERTAVEEAYTNGILLVLASTSTLSAGVNLPASRVIVMSPHTWKGQDFITCSSYLQQIGRAGRGVGHGDADSYIFLTPEQVDRFSGLLSRHVESVCSQMVDVASHYKRSATSGKSENTADEPSLFSGISRVILAALEVGSSSGVCVEEVIHLYTATLLYQQGEQSTPTGTKTWSLSPLFSELQRLIGMGYVQLARSQAEEEVAEITVTLTTESGPQLNTQAGSQLIGLKKEFPLEVLTPSEIDDYMHSLDKGALNDEKLSVRNCMLTVTPFTAAATAGNMSLDDAHNFVQEADQLEKVMNLSTRLYFLYLSITAEMSRGLVDSGPSVRQDTTGLIHSEIGDRYESHPQRSLFEAVGLTENKVMAWIRGAPIIRRDAEFRGKLTRMWSALFMSDLCSNPEQYEVLCDKYGFDRGMALELASSLANRCYNIRVFCLMLEKYWWYPSLASRIAPDLLDAAKEELRPLLVIRNVTPERAKVMIKMGLRSVRDVALVTPASKLSDQIKYLGQGQAEEMVMDARLILSNEAVEFAAESNDRKEALARNTADLCRP